MCVLYLLLCVCCIIQGAGMIEPHLATMLVYVLTDLDLPKDTLNKMLRAAVSKSFNAISVCVFLVLVPWLHVHSYSPSTSRRMSKLS